ALSNRTMMDQGIKLMQEFVPDFVARGGAHSEKPTGIWLSECFFYLPGLCWLGKLTGDASFLKLADEFYSRTCELTQDANGLWHHWISEKSGEKSAFWSRGQ